MARPSEPLIPGRGGRGGDDGSSGDDTRPPPSLAEQHLVARQGDPVALVYGPALVTPRPIYSVGRPRQKVWSARTGDGGAAVREQVDATTADVVLALGEAPFAEAPTSVIRGRDRIPSSLYTALTDLVGVVDGAIEWTTAVDPAPWAHLNPAASGQRFRGVAQGRFRSLGMLDGRIPDLRIPVRGLCWNAALGGAVAADVLLDLLARAGVPASMVEVDLGLDGLAASSYRRYTSAAPWPVGRAITEQITVRQAVDELLQATNSTITKSQAADGSLKLKVVPLGDRPVDTYSPPATAAILDDDELEYEKGKSPVQVEITREEDVYNAWPVSIVLLDGTTSTYEWVHAAHAAERAARLGGDGIRRAKVTTVPWLFRPEDAIRLSMVWALRSVHVRNAYRVRLGPRWGLPEPGDVVQLRHGALEIDALCRIRSIDLRERGRRELLLQEVPEGVATPVDLTPQARDGASGTPVASTVPELVGNRATTDLSNVPPGQVPAELLTPGQANTDNLWPNPTSESAPPEGASAATLASAEFAGRHASAAYVGGFGRRITVPAAGEVVIEHEVPCLPGEAFVFEAWSRIADAGTYSEDAPGKALRLRWRTAAGATISDSVTRSEVEAWGALAVTGTAPGTAQKVALQLVADSPESGGCVVDFDSIAARKMVRAVELAAASVITQPYAEATGTVYPEGTSGTYATSGAKFHNQGDPASVTPILVAPTGIRVGRWRLDEPVVRAANALARPLADSNHSYYRGNSFGAPVLMDPAWAISTAYVVGARRTNSGNVYRCTTAGTSAASGGPTGTGSSISDGSCVWAYVGTIAAEERIRVTNVYAQNPVTGLFLYKLELRICPRTNDDNLDALRSIKVEGFTSAGGSPFDRWYEVPPDRRYQVPGTVTDEENAPFLTLAFPSGSNMRAAGAPNLFNGYVRATLANALGRSTRDYGPGVNTADSAWPGGATIPGASSPPPPDDDPSEGGTCPAPETPILLPGGVTAPAGVLEPGDLVWTLPEDGGAWAAFPVTHVSRHTSRRVRVVVRDGRELVVSPLHRVAVPGGWAHSVDLAGALLADGGEVVRVEDAGEGEVVRITVDGARTYVAGGVLSHNAKPRDP